MKPMDDQAATKAPGAPEAPDAARRRGTWIARYKPDLSVRFFSSSADAPRARRPTDLTPFCLAAVTLGLVSLFAPDPTAADARFTELVKDSAGAPRVVLGDRQRPAGALAAGPADRGRRGIASAVPVAGSAGRCGPYRGCDDPRLRWVLGPGGRADGDRVAAGSYPAVRVAFAAALIATTAPHLGRPVRRLGRWVILLGSLGVVALSISLPLGVVSGSGDRVRVGGAGCTSRSDPPGGLPSVEQVRGGARGARGGGRRSAGGPSSNPRGSRSCAPRRRRVGRSSSRSMGAMPGTVSCSRRRGPTCGTGMRRRRSRSVGDTEVEHEAFITLLAERSGVPVLPVIAAGVAGARDGVLVLEAEEIPIQEPGAGSCCPTRAPTCGVRCP